MENPAGNQMFTNCIIHKPSLGIKPEEPLVSPQNVESWNTLLEAAKIRKHTPILELAQSMTNDLIPRVFYHRRCRSVFTMKRDLDVLKRKAKSSDDSNDDCFEACSNTKRPARMSSSGSRVYEQKCIFCEKDKCIKKTSTREKLSKAVDLRADATLRECAIRKCDTKMIAIVSRDIVAAEAQYHFSCYREYTRLQHAVPITTSKSETVIEEAYKELFYFIRNTIIPKKGTVEITVLAERLNLILTNKGTSGITDSMKRNLRRKLETELGNSIQIYHDNSGKLILVPETYSLQDAIKEIQVLKQELSIWKGKSSNISNIIDQASSHMRSIIQKNKLPTLWPYHPIDADNDSFEVPEHLQRFFLGLLTGNPKNEEPSNRVITLVQSFSQDIIYAVSCGQQKPPKHVLLPYAVKTLTGNVELIRTLNRLGHGISYSQLEENDTALCLQKLAAISTSQHPTLPTSIQPYVFTNLAWDNIDRREETLTGKGTTHRVNGIAVQARMHGPRLPPAALPKIDKQKQRTVPVAQEELPVYLAGERVGPQPITQRTRAPFNIETSELSHKKNLLWIIARSVHTLRQVIPSWTGFNIIMREAISVSRDVVSYMPTINAPATEMSTVAEILKQSECVRQMLHLPDIVVVMDQALYAKAAEIVWKHSEQYSHIILRLGAFHTICNVMSILGCRFQDAGLRDLCIESGLIAEGSINRVMDGKMYNRAIRVHKSIYEALMRLAWTEFIPYLEEKQPEKMEEVHIFLSKVTEAGKNEGSWNELLEVQSFAEVQSLWQKFLDHLRRENGDLSTFWMTYVDIVENVLLALLRAAREGNWQLHLSAIEAMIPWCFAYDKVNYARYLPAYYEQMANLPNEHPAVFEAFSDGHFSVQLSNSNPFGRIPVDQTTEVTVNKDTQTPGGTTKFNLKSGAVRRYYVTSEHRSAFLGQLREMVSHNKENVRHTDLQQTRIQKDEDAVSQLVSVIQSWVNPFSTPSSLISISTARAAPQDIATDLKNAKYVGEKCYAEFKTERLQTSPPVKKFHDPIKQNKLKTFSNLTKKKEIKSNGRSVILKADRTLFGRIIVMAQDRDFHMSDVLAHPLGPLPWALATPEGLMRKTNKAALAAALQKNVLPAETVPNNSATIIDGMLLIQKVPGDQSTFAEVAMFVLAMALKDGITSQRIDIVFDTYRENSIKDSERLARGEDLGMELKNITSSQVVRQWRKFLSHIGNKSSLIMFLVQEWKKSEYRKRLHGKVLFATCQDCCYQITADSIQEVVALKTAHEEADSRLFLHVAHAAAQGYQSVVINSDDTDVFIMCLAFDADIEATLFIKCGTRARAKILDVGKIAKSIGSNVCRALIGMHAYTGCDTVSAFAGKGKLAALKLISTNIDVYDACVQLGDDWNVSEQLMDKLEKFTCLIYGAKAGAMQVNDLRYHLFCAKKGDIESHQLPPCKDCLTQHAKRAAYQAAIWKRALEIDPSPPSPVGRGWRLVTQDGRDQLEVDWMSGQPAPQSVLDLLACTCPRSCKLPRCVCMANGLKCTDMCKLTTCDNQRTTWEDGTSAEDAADDDDDNDF